MKRPAKTCTRCGAPYTPEAHRQQTSRFCSVACRRLAMHGSRCYACGLLGHTSAACHVMARGARVPDRADELAQRLIPARTRERSPSIEDIRRDVAATLRDLLARVPEAAE